MALLELKKASKTDLNEFLQKILESAANTLEVERVSIWFYNQDRNAIYCDYIYQKNITANTPKSNLYIKDYPEYFKAIESQLYVAANDAQNDPRTKELADRYLKPRNVYSLLDIPIHFRGKTAGIICHEDQERSREWKREEIDFSAALSVLVSAALEIDFRKKKGQDLEESQRFLATLISNLPGYVYRVIKEGENWSIQYISEGVYDLTGYHPEELLHNRVLYFHDG
jgi:GAF domain-containing protein